MSSDGRRWMNGIFRAIPEVYSSIFLVAFVYIFYFIYILSLWMIARKYSNLDSILTIPSLIKILIMPLLILYLFIGTSYFADGMKIAFSKLEGNKGSEGSIGELKADLDRVFAYSRAPFALIAVIILSFIFTPPPEKSSFMFYSLEKGLWTSLLDIINWLSTVIILYLMAKVLWIIICVSWALQRLSREPFKDAVKIDLYSSDNLGGLASLRNLILFLAIFQFGGISLAMVSFSSSSDYGQAILFFVPIFLFSVYLFLSGWYVIDDLLEAKRAYEVNIINYIYSQKKQLLLNAITNGNICFKVDTDELSKSLNILFAERERLLNASKIVYDYKAIFVFITSSLLPFITQYIIHIPKS